MLTRQDKSRLWRDKQFMAQAFKLAKRGLGHTSPNPLVGAILVKQGKIIGRGWHQKTGGPHAEVAALKNCRTSPKGATLYVNLEPCCHWGKTPPCTDAIIKAGIKRVVVALKDPNLLVNGKGLRQLRQAGIKVEVGLMKKEAEELNAPFIFSIKNKRPYVILKAAMTLDGKIAPNRRRQWPLSPSVNRWITCPKSRQWVHRLRSQVDAILVGVNTVLADDPRLTVRLGRQTTSLRYACLRRQGRDKVCSPSIRKQPLRIILDPQAKTPVKAKALKQQGITIIATNQQNIAKKQKKYQDRTRVWPCPSKQGKINLNYLLKQLGKQGVRTLLIEGGAEVFTSFIDQGLVDKYYFFIAPKIYGPKGLDFYQNKNQDFPEGIPLRSGRFIINGTKKLGEDLLIEADPFL